MRCIMGGEEEQQQAFSVNSPFKQMALSCTDGLRALHSDIFLTSVQLGFIRGAMLIYNRRNEAYFYLSPVGHIGLKGRPCSPSQVNNINIHTPTDKNITLWCFHFRDRTPNPSGNGKKKKRTGYQVNTSQITAWPVNVRREVNSPVKPSWFSGSVILFRNVTRWFK